MFLKLKNLLNSRSNKDTPVDEDCLRLASATLLMEAAQMDGLVDEDELSTIIELLSTHFQLDSFEAGELADAGRKKMTNSVDLYGFTKTIKDSFNNEDRVKMVEMLWQVAYADGKVHDFEANLVRRICGLIYVSDRESGEARKRVIERLDLSN